MTGLASNAQDTAKASLHARLLCMLRNCIKPLPAGTTYNGESTYLDLFGSTLASRGDLTLVSLSEEWINWVATKRSVNIDLMLTPKTGNILLAYKVSDRLASRPALSTMKGPLDRSRVQVEAVGSESDDDGKESPVNYEGFLEFIAANVKQYPKLGAIGFDDNCVGGTSLVKGLTRFNGLIAGSPASYPVNLVRDAVVLFRRSIDQTKKDDDFSIATDLNLHGIIDIGDDEIRELNSLSPSAQPKDYESMAARLLEPDLPWLRLSQELYEAQRPKPQESSP